MLVCGGTKLSLYLAERESTTISSQRIIDIAESGSFVAFLPLHAHQRACRSTPTGLLAVVVLQRTPVSAKTDYPKPCVLTGNVVVHALLETTFTVTNHYRETIIR